MVPENHVIAMDAHRTPGVSRVWMQNAASSFFLTTYGHGCEKMGGGIFHVLAEIRHHPITLGRT